jgi:hypothetical protein
MLRKTLAALPPLMFWKRMRNRYEGNQDIVLGIN